MLSFSGLGRLKASFLEASGLHNTQWRNGNFAARRRQRAGRTFEKNFPEKFCKKMTFFDQKAVF